MAKRQISAVHEIPTWNKLEKNAVNAVIETPRDQRHKYAFDEKTGLFRLSMLLAEGLQWPYDYGFIPQTLAADGDALDVLYLGEKPTFTGCLVSARIIGVVRLKKNGKENDRVLGCPLNQKGLTQKSDPFNDISDVPEDMIQSICRYLVDYSTAEGNDLEFKGTGSRKAALKAIEHARSDFKKANKLQE
ncbi:MAG TPA: inorganic diphosphatase [Candidatus Tumulicola sp.]